MTYDPELGAGGIMKKKADMGLLLIKHSQCEKMKKISPKIIKGGLHYDINNNAKFIENSRVVPF